MLNSNYIKIKRNRKLEAKFFGPFWVPYPVSKQAYKIELPKKWRIHDVFHMLLLDQDTTKNRQVDKTTSRLEFEIDGNGKKYEVEEICNSTVYTKESDSGHHLPGLYYLPLWKDYPEKENTWEPALAMLYFCKLISTFHRNHPEKSTATFLPINSVPPMARPKVKPRAEVSSKQKRSKPAKDSSTSKRVKKT